MTTAAHEPGRTAYEARFAGMIDVLDRSVPAWSEVPDAGRVAWARVEEAVLASARPSPADPVRAALAYTSAVGDAGASYLKSVSLDGEYHLSGTFRWHELFDAMMAAALSDSTPTGEGEATGTQTVPDRMSVAYWHRLQADELQQRAGENDTAWIIRLRQHFASSETEEEEA